LKVRINAEHITFTLPKQDLPGKNGSAPFLMNRQKITMFITPAKADVQNCLKKLDSCFCRNEGIYDFLRVHHNLGDL